MDPLQTRLDALEHHVQTLQEQTRTINRKYRWWRRFACGLMALALLTWALPAGTAPQQSLEQRVSALETLLVHFTRQGNEVFITGANLHLVNGQRATTTTNGRGNLIVGYNELRGEGQGENIRTGSHNVVVGQWHNFSRFGGLVVGQQNAISGDFAVVSGGVANTASGLWSTVSGGAQNTARGRLASVVGGTLNDGNSTHTVVMGGDNNEANGDYGVAIGGADNTVSGFRGMAIGGGGNVADGGVVISGAESVASAGGIVMGGSINRANGGVVVGGDSNTASGPSSVVSGGQGNTASGASSAVSGGRNRTAEGEFDWVAGSLFEDE